MTAQGITYIGNTVLRCYVCRQVRPKLHPESKGFICLPCYQGKYFGRKDMKRKTMQEYLADPRVPELVREAASAAGVIRQDIAKRIAQVEASENPDQKWLKDARELLSKPSNMEQYIIDTLDKMDGMQ